MFGDFISAILMGLVPCYSRSGYRHEAPTHDRAQVPRQAKHKSRKHKRNAVAMTVTRRRMLRGICLPYDFNRSGISMVRIRLNKAMFQLDPKEEIWGTVVHEMLHAYLDLNSNWGGLMQPHHGLAFDETCEALVNRLAIEGFEVRHVI